MEVRLRKSTIYLIGFCKQRRGGMEKRQYLLRS